MGRQLGVLIFGILLISGGVFLLLEPLQDFISSFRAHYAAAVERGGRGNGGGGGQQGNGSGAQARPNLQQLEQAEAALKPDQPKIPTLPTFPWPPPAPSAMYVIPNELLRPESTAGTVYLRDIADRIESVLSKAVYFAWTYHAAPNGFAMVTRMEQILPDGRTDPNGRWFPPIAGEEFWLVNYQERLLFADPALYRIIVFFVSDQPFTETGEAVNPLATETLLASGFETLAFEIMHKPYTANHKVTALVYELRKPARQDPELLLPGTLPGRTHLERAELFGALEALGARTQ